MLIDVKDRMVDPEHRYVATAICPLGGKAEECAALEQQIFDYEAAASAALVEHLASAGCHTQAQLARLVGAAPANVRSFRLVREDPGVSSRPRFVLSDGIGGYASTAPSSPRLQQLAPKGQAA